MREKRLSKGVLRHNRVTFKKLKKKAILYKDKALDLVSKWRVYTYRLDKLHKVKKWVSKSQRYKSEVRTAIGQMVW